MYCKVFSSIAGLHPIGPYPNYFRKYLQTFQMIPGSSEPPGKSCPTFCDPMDSSLPGFSVHGIFQVRVLEWAADAEP